MEINRAITQRKVEPFRIREATEESQGGEKYEVIVKITRLSLWKSTDKIM